jgi:protein MpaA
VRTHDPIIRKDMRVARTVLVGLAAALLSVQSAFAEPRTTSIGTSQDGSPLMMYVLGEGPKRVLVLGGQHGGPEVNTVELVGGLLDYFADNPGEVPPGIELNVLPIANPDGLAAGSRQFASGVDPNRNWGSSEWRADAFDSNAVFRAGLGGPQPFSEQETRALADWVLAVRPAFIVNYHSAGGFMFGPREGPGADLASAYADASGYYWPSPGGGSGQRGPLAYSATGSMNSWLRQVGVPGILVELSTPRSTEIERNLAGITAVLAMLGSGV